MANAGKEIKDGIRDGFPIFLGYFTTALAFGLLTRTSGFTFVEGVLVSITNFAGSGQFLMMNLYNAGTFLLGIALSVFFINSRYIFMAASLSGRLKSPRSIPGRLMCGFGTTDEVFAVASFKGIKLPYTYMAGLIFTSYSGWVSGTAVGYIAGTFLPDVVQKAAVITVYAMFASLLGGEVRKNTKALLTAGVSALINSVMILGAGVSTGLSFLISLIAATIFGAIGMTNQNPYGGTYEISVNPSNARQFVISINGLSKSDCEYFITKGWDGSVGYEMSGRTQSGASGSCDKDNGENVVQITYGE